MLRYKTKSLKIEWNNRIEKNKNFRITKTYQNRIKQKRFVTKKLQKFRNFC